MVNDAYFSSSLKMPRILMAEKDTLERSNCSFLADVDIFALSLHEIRSSGGKCSWLTFILGKVLP